MPTAMELAGGASGRNIGGTPMPLKTDGISFVPTLLGRAGEQKQHAYFYWEFHENGFHQAILVREGNWKAVRHGLNSPIELYDLNKDIAERINVAAQNPEAGAKIRF